MPVTVVFVKYGHIELLCKRVLNESASERTCRSKTGTRKIWKKISPSFTRVTGRSLFTRWRRASSLSHEAVITPHRSINSVSRARSSSIRNVVSASNFNYPNIASINTIVVDGVAEAQRVVKWHFQKQRNQCLMGVLAKTFSIILSLSACVGIA
ncbi:hypothetical protein BC830DRAFT_1080127 [Chytriomyces sp. MP71]|nr:hypothetical protein BC830DRAFT_1080127 [Chytriomyces sp. MP71]